MWWCVVGVRIRLEERRSGPALRRFGRAGGCSFSWSVFSWVEFSRRPFIAMCGVARLGSASRDQATGLVVGGTHHNSSKGDTADPVVWSLFCSGLGDCCPIFALFARGRADRSALTIHLLRSCWDPPFHIWFPGRRCSRGTLRVSSMLSPTNQSAARRLSSGTKNN